MKKNPGLLDTVIEENKLQFCYEVTENVEKVLNPSKIFGAFKQFEEGDSVELSPSAYNQFSAMADLMKTRDLGAMLTIDYGGETNFSNSVRGIFKQKMLKDEKLLENVGEMDLSAYVNFKSFKKICSNLEIAHHPLINQGSFLQLLGVDMRKEVLLKNCLNEKQREAIEWQYNKIVVEMNETFYAFLCQNRGNTPIYPFVREVYEDLQLI